ncbi:helix-turn-helix domain-containing protein [Metasolibacillus meyeri]|uniref:helix-turn-helix domain-containing protein n=1 Tax=Metasolibacillus meyeri TaxID=1071052 RepID=UPI00187D47ED|nr:helix-turn-helix transcriptional regulator [Metasolibacillus meyeri]
MNRGTTLKEIRKNKNYTQIEVSQGITSQGTYSKYEANIRDVDTEVYIQLLDKLSISLEEFEYIHNNYSYGKKKEIIQLFFKLNYNNPDKLRSLEKQASNYLLLDNDIDIKEIKLICKAFLKLSEGNINEAREIIQPIWERLSKFDQLYIHDIGLINTILFLFPVNIAIDFTNNVLKRLDTYTGYREVELLKSAFNINLSLLLIKNRDFVTALAILEKSLQKYRQIMNYSILALHFSRKAICLFHLKNKGSQALLKQADQLLALYKDEQYYKKIKSEYDYYTSSKFN